METTYYEIRVRGRLSKTLLGAFPGLHAQMQGAETVLAGALPDQAALYGALTQIEALGLELLEVRRSQAQELRRSQAQEHGQNAPAAAGHVNHQSDGSPAICGPRKSRNYVMPAHQAGRWTC